MIAAHEETGPLQPLHLLGEEQAGAVVLPVLIVEIAGDNDERHVLRDREINQGGKRPPRAVPHDLGRNLGPARQPCERAIEMDVGRVQEFHGQSVYQDPHRVPADGHTYSSPVETEPLQCADLHAFGQGHDCGL